MSTIVVSKIDELIRIAKKDYEYYGLSIQIYEHARSLDPAYKFSVFQDVTFLHRNTPEREIYTRLMSIAEDIKKSPYVTKLKEEAKSREEELQARIDELEKYETYYNMAKDLK